MNSVTRVRAALFGVALAAGAPISGYASPLPSGFVHLSEIDPTIGQDIRYAGFANFLGRPAKGYDGESCIVTKQAASALARVQQDLQPQGLALVVFDCYRPAVAVADFVAWTREGGPADPRWHPRVRRDDLIRQGYIASRSAHSRGSTVDVGLLRLEDKAIHPDPDCGAAGAATIDLGTGFDCFDPKSRTSSQDVGREARANRRLLVEAMDRAGFRNYSAEWWHFTLRGEPYPGKAFDFPVTAP
jgi:D-alanyl-D-alanine dipeptidase